jgi:hypothetical protein
MMGAIGLLIPIAIIALIIVGIRKAMEKGGLEGGGHGVRRFFQYLLLLGLLIISAMGLAGLLGRLLEGEALVRADQAGLARNLTFALIGLPLYLGVAVWSRRRMADDPREVKSLGWVFYITVASLVSLVVAMFALYDVLEWAFQVDRYDGNALARFLVWGGAWALHWMVDVRVTPTARSQVHRLAGSLIGLGTASVGLIAVLSEALAMLLVPETGEIIAGDDYGLLRGVITILVGAPVWYIYWLRTAARAERTPLWNGYVLVFGVGGGLATAIIAASTLVYQVLVWLVGNPGTSDAGEHFTNAPATIGSAAVGILIWWYHHAVLEEAGVEGRSEPRRVYEYLMAATGLLAAAGGLATLLVAFIEALAGTSDVIVGDGATNTLLAAVTLLVVGGPVWWFYWRRIQKETRADPAEEHASPTRRIYLYILFGVGGVAAVIALIAGVFIFLEDVFEETLGMETLRGIRFAVGVLLTTGAIAGYHWAVYRADREVAPAVERGPRYVLLVGPVDGEIIGQVRRLTGGRVQVWPRTDGRGRPWSVDEVAEALSGTTEDEVVVIAGEDGLEVVPVDRG